MTPSGANSDAHADFESPVAVFALFSLGGCSVLRPLKSHMKKISGKKRLSNRWKLVPKNKLRKKRGKRSRGYDILVEANKPKGWDEDSYEETPATDVKPILLPWEDKTRVLYTFDSGTLAEEVPR